MDAHITMSKDQRFIIFLGRGYGWGRKKADMARTKTNPPAKVDKRYLICPWCGEKVQYLRRRGHSCFKFHLSEIERNARQMSRD
jgi:hypothetical protein